jgi:NitT/TauT family transport system permease protein
MSSAVLSACTARLLGIFSSKQKTGVQATVDFFAGLLILFALWWFGVFLATLDPATEHFRDFGPLPAFELLPELFNEGLAQSAVLASMYRLGSGLLLAILIGVPIGIMIGLYKRFREISNSPFQLMRMISPLSWEPIAIIVFVTWDSAIIFLITVAAIWPIAFSTAAGLTKVDPAWFKVARNLGAKPWQLITQVVVPAITFDVITGIRLALGIGWIVLVPAEFLGVTEGLGYSVQDAREGLEYDYLMAVILIIGAVGYLLDSAAMYLIKRTSWHRGDQ